MKVEQLHEQTTKRFLYSTPVLRKSLTCLGRIQIQVYLPEIFDGSASYMGMHQRGAPIIAVEVTTWICHMCDILDIQYIDVSRYTKSPDVQLQCLQLRFQTNKFKIQTKSGPIFSKIWTKSGPFASRIRTQQKNQLDLGSVPEEDFQTPLFKMEQNYKTQYVHI